MFGDDKVKRFLALTLLFILISSKASFALEGDLAYRHLIKLSEIGNRVLCTESEKIARDYIKSSLEMMGYKPKIHKFKVNEYETCNIEVSKKGVSSSGTVIVGAHYDGRIEGNSFDDNGSGVSILLELCQLLKDANLPYDTKFIFFGAEEINALGRGLHGSYDYVESLSKRELGKIKYMINLDTLLSGDHMHVYNMYKEEDPNDYSLELISNLKELANSMNIDLRLNTKSNDSMSFTNTKSDYYPFFEAGVPVLYFESTNWNIGECDGRSQNDMFGRIIHTPLDNMIFLENFLDERIKERLTSYTSLIKEFLLKNC